MFKLRLYHENGANRGNPKEERLFDTMEEMYLAYKDITHGVPGGPYRPTAWVYNRIDGEWYRIHGY